MNDSHMHDILSPFYSIPNNIFIIDSIRKKAYPKLLGITSANDHDHDKNGNDNNDNDTKQVEQKQKERQQKPILTTISAPPPRPPKDPWCEYILHASSGLDNDNSEWLLSKSFSFFL